MLSLRTALATTTTNDPSKKKRKHEDDIGDESLLFSKELKLWSPDHSPADIELHLEDAPLPPEWQRCLDIRSGLITFYNTRTRTRTTRDPRRGEPPPRSPVRLNLDLNLGSKSPESPKAAVEEEEEEEEEEMDCKEMVAGVCMRCHMLVMMRRSAPACPNCKFLHPPQTAEKGGGSSGFTKTDRFRLLCCTDRGR